MKLFNRIFVEREVENHPNTAQILGALKRDDAELIDDVEAVFNRVKKPYLQKRDNLNLFIGKKRGELVKEAPNAYGAAGESHYYFIHAYNCIYECEYCYLQGYFHSPDIVLFVNHDEIIAEMASIAAAAAPKRVWFHAGEFSDSLALNALTNEYDAYWDFFRETPNAFLELRTKSVNISRIKTYEPIPNAVVSFSLSPTEHAAEFDRKTAPTSARLKAMQTLAALGFCIGVHLDPIIDTDTLVENYTSLAAELARAVPAEQIAYISLGVVRYTKDVFREVERNYPSSALLSSEYVKSFDNKVRYSRPHRMWILNTVKSLLLKQNIPEPLIYFCMED